MGEDRVVKELYRDFINNQVRLYAKHGHLTIKLEGKKYRYNTLAKTTLPPYKGEFLDLPFRIRNITKPKKRKT
jgi:hypothetical protein